MNTPVIIRDETCLNRNMPISLIARMCNVLKVLNKGNWNWKGMSLSKNTGVSLDDGKQNDI